jgi:tetratricopeptide (TPR) repeat protein
MKAGDVVEERFEIERLAGSGGMGAVYRTLDRRAGAPAAVKVLWPQFVEQPEQAERFAREARVLQELDHPGIVRYLAHGVTGEGEPYLALEWLEGEPLSQRLRREGLTVAESVSLGRRLADALGAAHRKGVVHRDLKPSNIFLPGRSIEAAKLIDFGIAKAADGAALTVTGMVMGTPFYMAPEQARGSRRVDARADVFALGCVLFHCLTGRAPFAGEQMHAALLKVVLDDAPRLVEVRDDIPASLDALVARMLSRDPDGRPADGAAVARELEALGDLGGSGAAPASTRGGALTGREVRVVCAVVLRLAGIGPLLDPGATPPTAPMTLPHTLPMGSPDPLRPAVEAAVARHQGRLHDLTSGALLVTFRGAGAATDQAAQAARCALALRLCAPGAPIAAVAGRGAPTLTAEGGEVLERGLGLLRASSRAVRLDEVIAGLLGARFQIEGDAGGLVLAGEREEGPAARTVLGKPTPCLGRDHELAILDAVLAGCVSEPCARAVLVLGGAGIGKSRIAHELQRRAHARGAEVWTAHGDPMSAGSPFGMLAQALRREAGAREGEPPEVQRQKLRARVARHVLPREVGRVAQFLGELAGIPDAAESVELRAARADPVLMGDQMRRAFEDLLVAETQDAPLVLVLEDLHWGDLPSVKFLDATLRNLRERPLFVLALGRPEVSDIFPRLWAERGVQHVHLRELSRRGSESLVREVLGDDVDAEVARRIVDCAAGNPFYLEELIRAAAAGEADFPETVLAMVEARLAALAPEARRLLRAGSVFGQVFWRGGLAALLGAGASGLDEALPELVDRELLARRGEGRFPGEEEYTFRHGLVREAAYAMLPAEDRALGHRLAAAWLEEKGEREALVLAEHKERGGEHEGAVAWFRRAAEQALEGDDFAAAIARAERGAAHARGETLGALRLLEAEAHKWQGSAAEAERCAVEAMRRLPPRSPLWYVAASEAASMRLRLGRHDELGSLAAEVRATGLGMTPSAPPPPPSASGPLGFAPTGPTPPLWMGVAVSAVARLAGSLLHDGQHALAESLIAEIDRLAGPLAERDFAVAARIYALHASRALCYGDPAAALRFTELSIPSFAYTGDRRNACLGRVNAAHALLQLGDERQAERALRSALSDASVLGLHNVSALGLQNLAVALARQGALDEARASAAQAIGAFAAQSNRRQEGRSRVYLAEILAARGDAEAAEREARAAVLCVVSIPPLKALALGVLARVLLTREKARAALEAAREGVALRDALAGMEEGEALLRLALAESLDASGDRRAAEDAIRAARERLLARAAGIPEPGFRQSFLRRVPENARTLALARAWLGDVGEA